MVAYVRLYSFSRQKALQVPDDKQERSESSRQASAHGAPSQTYLSTRVIPVLSYSSWYVQMEVSTKTATSAHGCLVVIMSSQDTKAVRLTVVDGFMDFVGEGHDGM